MWAFDHPGQVTYKGSPGNTSDKLVLVGKARAMVPEWVSLTAGSVHIGDNGLVALSISGSTSTFFFTTSDGRFHDCTK